MPRPADEPHRAGPGAGKRLGVGDVIRVANVKSKNTVLAEVIDANTVRVSSQHQTASRQLDPPSPFEGMIHA